MLPDFAHLQITTGHASEATLDSLLKVTLYSYLGISQAWPSLIGSRCVNKVPIHAGELGSSSKRVGMPLHPFSIEMNAKGLDRAFPLP